MTTLLPTAKTTEAALFCWSGGKDSAMALYYCQQKKERDIAALLTTIVKGPEYISMHQVPRLLLEEQVKSLGLPLEVMPVVSNPSNEAYEEAMRRLLEMYRKKGVNRVIFGDIFLQDLREYREKQLDRVGMTAEFPLWRKDTRSLAAEFIRLGFRAIIVSVDSRQIDSAFIGREYDESLLADLPANADPCGENGEFHTFVTDGPNFSFPLKVKKEEMTCQGDFYYCRLVRA
jgi:uncharacterized protein (TIGR00290 family)